MSPETSSVKLSRQQREARTLSRMIRIYCKAHHAHRDVLCLDCVALEAYALERLRQCPFGGGKPACSRCPVHCYRRQERQTIRRVMRYSGSRMIWRHPVLSCLHLLDCIRSRQRSRPAASGSPAGAGKP